MKKLLERIAELAEYVDFEMRAEFADRIDKLRKQIDSNSNESVIAFDDAFPTLDKLNPVGYTKLQAPKRLSRERLNEIWMEVRRLKFNPYSVNYFFAIAEAIQQEVSK